MTGANAERCRYPGCARPVAPAPPGGGRPPSYCSDPSHNRVRAFRARQQSGTDVLQVEPAPPVAGAPEPREPGPTVEVTPEARLAAETRRADRAEAVAEERREQLRDAEERAERRMADLLDRLMIAGDELAELRAELAMLRRGTVRVGREPAGEQACGGAG